MWKIIRQFHDFGRFFFTTFGIFGFFSPKSKYPKRTVLKKWKFEDFFSKIQQLISHFIYIIVIVWFFLLFVCFSDFHVFQYCEKCVAVTPSRFQYFNISTKQNFLSNKKSRSMSLRYGLGAKNPILPTFGTKTQRWKIIRQFHDFGPFFFNNFWNFWGFF